MSVLIQTIAQGLLTGGIFALIAVGLSLVYGVTEIINVTHGIFLLLGGYFGYWLWALYGVSPFLALPLVLVANFLIGFTLEKFIFGRVIGEDILLSLLATFGVTLIIFNLMLNVWSADYRSISLSMGTVEIPGVVTLPIVDVVILAVSITSVALLYVLLEYTEIGYQIRASAQDKDAAELMGINVPRIYAITFGLGIGLAGVSGVLLAIVTPISPVQHGSYLLIAFIVVVLGGVGSVVGSLSGGLALGLVQSFSTMYLGSGFKEVILFTVLVVALLVKPDIRSEEELA